MKKIGIFFYSFLPLLLSVSFQFIALAFLLGIEILIRCPGQSASELFPTILTLMTDTDFMMMMSVVFAVINIATFGIWYYCQFEGNFLPNPKTTFHPSLFGGLLLAAPAAQLGCGILMTILAALQPGWMRQYEELMQTSGLDNHLTPLMILYAVVLGPIGEELIFRGVTLRSVRRIFPFWAANLFQALLFGIFHMNIMQGCYAFALGIFLGIVCEKFGSIYYSIFLHICFNFLGTVLGTFTESINTPLAVLAYYAVILIMGIVSIFLFKKGWRWKLHRPITLLSEEDTHA